ncbi:dicarboxylate/amino acid:cation symporter [uncultured Hoeflea sp.]|uniref:dicarboxylate/amino acid:cation symporter n=1 Tax=uncultured Hoeflea sp. TaxID=538666 RepID=UPI0026035148|nr:dicarboxylate/amino acid:cation symporter [uncultured Hoeflea sp.]
MIRTQLWAQILAALVLGVGFGLLFSPETDTVLTVSAERIENLGAWLKLPGGIFLNMIQMIVIPLIISSIALGLISAGDPVFLRKAGTRIVPYFVSTTTIAVLIGAALATWFEPGAYVTLADPVDLPAAASPVATQDTPFAEQISSLIPTSLTAASLSRDMLQIVLIAIFLGVALVSLPERTARPMIDLLGALQAVALKIVAWAMLLAPIAVFGLICEFVMRAGLDALLGMSAYIFCVVAGLILLLFVYLGIVAVLAARNPLQFSRSILDAQLLAFATSSSAATMPVSMRVALDSLGVRPAIVRFIIPLGATVNMDGTALYQVVATLFMAQIYGITLDPASFALIVLTVVGASIGSPSTPGVGIVILSGILASIGIPPEGVAILLGVDRLLDMCRTAVNVSGDLTACVVMNRWLAEPDNQETRTS